LLLLALTFQNCDELTSANIETDSGSSTNDVGAVVDPPAPVVSAQCLEADYNQISISPLRRMLKIEVKNSYSELFGEAFMTHAELEGVFDIVNDDTSEDSLIDYEKSLAVVSILGVSDAVVDHAVETNMSLVSGAVSCSGDTSDACLSWYLKFAEKALKRPLENTYKTELSQFFYDYGLNSAMKRVLLSPQFLFHLELTDSPIREMRRVTPYEVAHRISFQITGSLPDDLLREAAAQNRLSNKKQIKTQVERLLAGEKSKTHIKETFKVWLGLDRVPDPSTKLSKHYAIDGVGYGQEAEDELDLFLDYILYDKKGGFKDLMLDKSVFPFSDRLALNTKLDVSSSKKEFSDFRGGILFRPASLVSSLDYSDPIQRGVYFRKRVLCDKIPPPTDDILESRSEEINSLSHEDFANRHIVTTITAGACMGCHSQINPIGYVLEGVDPFGAPREVEKIFDSNGDVIARHSLDTSVEDLDLESNFENLQPASSPEDLGGYVSKSPKAMRCLSDSLVEVARQRASGVFESCVSEKMTVDLYNNSSIQEVLLNSIVSDDIFWLKKVTEVN